MNSFSSEKEEEEAMVGISVMSSYNHKLYRIEAVDYSKNPKSTFSKGKGKEG